MRKRPCGPARAPWNSRDRRARRLLAALRALVESRFPICREETGSGASRAAADRSAAAFGLLADSHGRSPRRSGRRCRAGRAPPRGRAPRARLAALSDRAAGARALGDRRRHLPAHLTRPRRGAGAGGGEPARARGPGAFARPAGRARPGAPRPRSRPRRARAPGARAARAHEARTRPLQVRAPACQRSGPGRLRGLAGAAAPGPDRHARGLVAAHTLVRLSVTQGVAFQARPRPGADSIAASVRR
jgi:hypothetical protein